MFFYFLIRMIKTVLKASSKGYLRYFLRISENTLFLRMININIHIMQIAGEIWLYVNFCFSITVFSDHPFNCPVNLFTLQVGVWKKADKRLTSVVIHSSQRVYGHWSKLYFLWFANPEVAECYCNSVHSLQFIY